MSDFSIAAPLQSLLEAGKRVKYSLGLVLGVDEFEQEQFYFLQRARLHNRALHGYGTVCGLRVTTDAQNPLKILVDPGLAINPQGKEIAVARQQCADLNAWLGTHREDAALGGPFGGETLRPLSLYITLGYRECETDQVPVPGAPCRSEDETLAPARITETFDLGLSAEQLTPGPDEQRIPPHAEEELAVRRFGDLLRRIEIASGAGNLSPAELADLVRALNQPAPTPVESPPTSPPQAETILLHPADAERALRGAFRVWVTEVRPGLLPTGQGCTGGPPIEAAILLARLNFVIDRTWQVVIPPDSSPILIDEEDRPYLLHTRLLQEFPLLGLGRGESGGMF